MRLYRVPVATGAAEAVISDRARVGAFVVARSGAIAYTFPGSRDLAQLYVREATAPAPARKGVPRVAGPEASARPGN